MAGIDYGCIMKMNNIIYSNSNGILLDGMGNTEYPVRSIMFYKDSIQIFNDAGVLSDVIFPIDYYYHGKGKKYRLKIRRAGIDFDIKRIDDGNRYIAKFKIDDNKKYEVIYGYGVDFDLDAWYGLKPSKKEQLKRWIDGAIVW